MKLTEKILIALLAIVAVCAQTDAITAAVKIGGVVVDDANGKPIDNVLCSIRRGKGAPVAYTFTGRDGHFTLQAEPKDSVSFSLIGYAKLTLPVSAVGTNAKIKLTAADFALKEIVVKAPPIREHGDTLVYDVASFKSQNDRYISDVLKKLPGVTVSDDGAIKYQGKPINKFYIEGRDLLEGRYTLASNGLDVNAVKKVEVIEHNQHIKSLQGLKPSERAAINLKLDKQFMVRPFGEIRGAIGNGPIYDAGLLVTLLTRGPQALVTLQGNNFGKNLESEANDKFNLGGMDTYIAPYSPLLSAPSLRRINIPLQRYMFNRSRLASINMLLPAGKDSELKINAIYTADRLRQQYDMNQTMMLGNGNTLSLFENAMTHTKIDNLKLTGIYEYNASRTYLRDEFGFSSQRERGISSMMTQSDSVDYSASSYPKEFFNKLSTNLRFGRSQLVSFSSHIRAGLSPERLDALYPTVDSKGVGEQMRMRHFNMKNYLKTSFSLFSHRIGMGAFINYSQTRPRFTVNSSGIEIPDEILPASAGIGSRISQFEYGIEPEISFRWLDNSLQLNLYPNVSGYDVSATVADVKHHTVKFLPSVSAFYRFSPRLEMRMGGNRNFSYQGERPFFPAPFLTNYRTVYIPSGDLNHTYSYSGHYTLNYRHSVKLLFANFNAQYTSRKSNFVSSSYNTSDWSCVTTRLRPNRNHTLNLSGEVSKTFASANTTIKLSPYFSFMDTEIAQQEFFTRNHYYLYALDLRLTNRKLRWLYAQYALTATMTRNSSKTFGTSRLTNWAHTLDCSFFPVDKLTIDLKGELSSLDNYSSGHDNFFFCDFGATYSIKRVSFSLTARNLFDTRQYSVSQFSSINESTRSLPLRGREIIATVKLKF